MSRKSKLTQDAEAMTLINLLQEYARWLTDSSKLAVSTQQTYLSDARSFSHWLGATAVVADVTTPALRRYMAEYRKTHRPRSENTNLFALRKLGSYMLEQGFAAVNPALALEPPKLDKAQRETPTDDQVTDLLAACERIADPYRSALARGVVSTLVFGGMRRAELLGLKVGDIDIRRGEIHLRRTKGGKELTIAPHRCCIDAVRDWLRMRHSIKGEWLWAQDRTRRLGDQGLKTLLEELAASAGMKGCKALLPHSIRHNFATRLSRAGVELDAIREALGHSDIKTTALYLHSDVARLHELSHLAELKPSKPAVEGKPKAAEPEPRKRSFRRGLR